MSILDYNDCKVNLAVLMIIDHFKVNNNNLYIQIHRGSSGLIYIKLLTAILQDYYKDEILHVDNNVFTFSNGFTLELDNGYKPETLKEHPGYHTLFSLSLMGGLSHSLPSGTITLPNRFIPFDTNNLRLDFTRIYEPNNYLIEIIDDILSVNQEKYFNTINTFKSQNPMKCYSAARLDNNHEDFTCVTVLQIDELWNPSSDMLDYNVEITGYANSRL